jgi:thioredoxin-like negative regulator of GroEL
MKKALILSLFSSSLLISQPIRKISSEDGLTEFETLLTYSKQPIFAIFSAPWCSVCNTIKSSLEKVMQDELLKDNVTFVTIDFDSAKSLCKKYNVDRIPTFCFFQDGKKIHQEIGVKRGLDVKTFLIKTIQDTFDIKAAVPQKIANNDRNGLKKIFSYVATPPLTLLKDGIEWCLQKLST